MLEANQRMRQYEEGEYGLADAVSEIKATKAQMNIRDRQIEELCQQINNDGIEKNNLKIENEHLRMKLGIPLEEEIDVGEYKKMKAIQREEERALNMVLQKEVS